ncbi:hypothetical protein GF373_15745 [bacterium]|nr:hypothetical protein [bacterium]
MRNIFSLSLVIIMGLGGYAASSIFHTSPAKWEHPRKFQTDIEREKVKELIQINHVPLKQTVQRLDLNKGLYSPNGGYWLLNNAKITNGTQAGQVYVFNERDYLIEFSFSYYANFGVKEKWINEKLIYLRIWRGRVKALDLIYNVEEETILYSEQTHDGKIPFKQFQGQQNNENTQLDFLPPPPRQPGERR